MFLQFFFFWVYFMAWKKLDAHLIHSRIVTGLHFQPNVCLDMKKKSITKNKTRKMRKKKESCM